MSFQIHTLHPGPFAHLFSLSDRKLTEVRAKRTTVDASPGYPCRVSLIDADVGETVILVNYTHQPQNSPFRAAHAIYVRKNAEQAFPDAGTIPEMFLNRLISIRAFNEQHFITNADVVEGKRLHETIVAIMHDSGIAYLHLHNAKLGCFLARMTRT